MPHKDPAVRAEYLHQYRLRHKAKILAQAKEYRENNPEKVSAAKKLCYTRSCQSPAWRATRNAKERAARARDPERFRRIYRRYYENNRDKILERQRTKNGSLATKARSAVSGATRYGRLPRASTMTCSLCGTSAQEYHHHRGYEQEHWLDVEPVCIRCHRGLHVEWDPVESAEHLAGTT